MDAAQLRLPPRDPDGHKGTFGTVCVIGGNAVAPRVMVGGPAFAARAALRSGAGLVALAVPSPLMTAALVIAPEATGLALPVDGDKVLKPSRVAEVLDEHIGGYRCLAVGPGWGTGLAQQQILVRLLSSGEVPMVIDADALNAIASLRGVHLDFKSPAILTPHPGEYRRLAAHFGLDAAEAIGPEARADAARSLAARLGCVVVLKGAATVVTDGIETFVNDTGGPALATAGTGDVLTGVIAGLVAQHFGRGKDGLTLLECAALGVRIHGRAGDLWSAEHGDAGLLAPDLLDRLPAALALAASESAGERRGTLPE